MRQAFLVIVLVAAAFAGGAIVNGPGQTWAQSVLNQIRPRAPGLVATTNADSAVPKTQDGDVAQGEPIPAAPVPPLVVGPVPEEPPAKPDLLTAQEDPPATPASGSDPSTAKLEPATTAPTTAKLPAAPSTSSTREVASRDRSLTPARGIPKPENGWGDAPGSAPAAAVLPNAGNSGLAAKHDPAVAQAAASSAATAPGGADALTESPSTSSSKGPAWPDLCQRMRQLGVTRYWLEGEPDGPVRFRCLIPLVGERAIAQHFEAEGDDAASAADAALVRVALWRATEAP